MIALKLGDKLKLAIVSKILGVSMGQLKGIWAFMNGKKTLVGAIIATVAYLAGAAGVLLPLYEVDAVVVGKVVGSLTFALGLLHKFYKFFYGEEPPAAK